MAFTATGPLLGQEEVSVTWDDGELEGDGFAVDYMRGLAKGFEGKALSIPTVFTSYENHLSKPLAVLALFEFAFRGRAKYSGDVPTYEETPEGAIS